MYSYVVRKPRHKLQIGTPTALDLLAPVTYCICLSLGQLQAQSFQPVRIGVNDCPVKGAPISGVKLASPMLTVGTSKQHWLNPLASLPEAPCCKG